MTLRPPNLQLPALGPIAPPPGTWGTVICGLQWSIVAGRFLAEAQNPTPYSKFALTRTNRAARCLPTRQGMLILYVPACFVAAYLWFVSLSDPNVAALLLAVHFAKRVFEVLLLHVYSGTMEVELAVGIGAFYALEALLISSMSLPKSEIHPSFLYSGITLFVIGQLGNYYHHYLLVTLRRDLKNTKVTAEDAITAKGLPRQYLPPKGGLFELVAMPHYFFEVVAWLGVALTSQQLNAFVEVVSHFVYLAKRAHNTNQLYFTTFDEKEWPRSRKNLVPFVY